MLVIFQNNVYLSLLSGCILSILYYLDNTRLKVEKRPPLLSYLKLLILTALLTYIVLYIRTKKLDIPNLKGGVKLSNTNNVSEHLKQAMTNVNIGEPDF